MTLRTAFTAPGRRPCIRPAASSLPGGVACPTAGWGGSAVAAAGAVLVVVAVLTNVARVRGAGHSALLVLFRSAVPQLLAISAVPKRPSANRSAKRLFDWSPRAPFSRAALFLAVDLWLTVVEGEAAPSSSKCSSIAALKDGSKGGGRCAGASGAGHHAFTRRWAAHHAVRHTAMPLLLLCRPPRSRPAALGHQPRPQQQRQAASRPLRRRASLRSRPRPAAVRASSPAPRAQPQAAQRELAQALARAPLPRCVRFVSVAHPRWPCDRGHSVVCPLCCSQGAKSKASAAEAPAAANAPEPQEPTLSEEEQRARVQE